MIKNLFLFTFLLLFFACEKKQINTVERTPFPVNAIIAENREIQDSIVSAVLLQGSKKANIISQTTGKIISVNTDLGKIVREGEILLTIENSVQAANLREVMGMVNEANLNFTANENLFKENKISKAEFIRSQNNLFAAQTALATAKKAFEDTRVTAPFDGVITMRNNIIQKGNSISADTPLFTIVDINKIKAIISLGEKEIGNIRSGSTVLLNAAAAGVEVSGKITAVSPGSDAQTGTFTVEAEFENPGMKILDGMSGIVSLCANETKFGIPIPSNAVINNSSVLLVQNGNAVSVPVSVESISPERVMILNGVSENDTIIITGMTQLSNGDTVSVNIMDN